MPELPDGEPAPADGRLPEAAQSHVGRGPLGIYVHVPYCRVRCGYCDFNTYTLTELGPGGTGGPQSFIDEALAELDLAVEVLGPAAAPQQAYPAPQVPAAYTPPPAQPMSPNEERTWGMASHLIGAAAMVLSAGFLGFVGSLVLYLVCKDRGPFVRAHAANSLNVQITAGIGFILGWILTITVIGAIIGIPLLIATFIWALVVFVIGAVKANNGEWWTPPMTIQFVK